MGMDCPSNIEDITDYVLEDVNDTADPKDWHSGDVTIGFRRWMESNAKAEPKECTYENETIDDVQKIAKGIIVLRKIEKARAELNKQLESLFELPLSLLAKDNVQGDHFKIVHQGFRTESQREEIQINIGEHGNLFLYKTDEGIVVDVYGQDDTLGTIGLTDDELNN